MAGQAHAVPVDVELVLLWDVSGSVSGTEYNTQRQGWGAAFKNAAFQTVIGNGANARIAIQIVQFAKSAAVSNVSGVAWTLVTAANATAFGNALDVLARNGSIGIRTDIADGIALGHANLIADNTFTSNNLVIDVSGDGRQNEPPSVTAARDAAVSAGITINGLAILNNVADLDTYYTNNVIGGPGAFVVVANSFSDFESAAIAKLTTEISGTSMPEPSTIILLGSGLIGLVAWRRKQQA